jgi:putative holliday junction resolvase
MNTPARILGIDYGSKRIGLALSDPLNIIAQAFKVILNGPGVIDEIAQLVSEYEVRLIVVGMPLNLKGDVGQKGVEVRDFIPILRSKLGIDIVEWDERFSSHTAQMTMRTMGVKKSRREAKGSVDAMAAAIILQGYLDRQAGRLPRQEAER